MTVDQWLCPELKETITLDQCKRIDCNGKKRCPIYMALIERDKPEYYRRKLPFYHGWTSAIINLSLKTLNKSKTINLPELQEKYYLIKGIIAELDVPNCGYRGYFYLENGQAKIILDGIEPDCILITSWQVIRQLYNGWTKVFDYRLNREVKVPYTPELAFNWDHIQLIKGNTEKNVLSAAYLFADELYKIAFPIIREQAKLQKLL
jgi:hypothetical protein